MPWQEAGSETLVEAEQAMLHCALSVVAAESPKRRRLPCRIRCFVALNKADVLVNELKNARFWQTSVIVFFIGLLNLF